MSFDRHAGEGVQTTLVTGSGDPNVDVAAVQAAVDQGGNVILRGRFSFDAPPTKPVPPQFTVAGGGSGPANAEVLISRAVNISGDRDEDGDGTLATIDGGTIPFFVDAPGQSVTIRNVRFVNPVANAMLVFAVQGIEVAASRIEGVQPFAGLSQGISIVTGNIPNPSNQGKPANITGTIRIVGNDIDMTGGRSGLDNTLGLTVFSVGAPSAEVNAYVIDNRIQNVTEPAINFRHIVGHANIEHNIITTGSVIGSAGRNQAIRVVNSGSYRVAHNFITCEWATSDATGIGVFSQFSLWPMENAVIEENDIRMRPPAGTVFTEFSAAIGVYGFAQNNVVRHNTIRGKALAGISIPSVFPLPPQAPANPQNNAFIRNRFVDFHPATADIFVGDHAVGTRIVGRGTVDDLGTGTVIERHVAPR